MAPEEHQTAVLKLSVEALEAAGKFSYLRGGGKLLN